MTITPPLLLTALALMAPGVERCPALEAAHAALLESSFTCVRHLTVELNGDLKAREVTRLTYRAGELKRETLEKELLDDNVVLEEGDEESALAVPFDCDRLERVGEGALELTNPAGTEKVVFAWNRASGALRPLRWTNNETERFLWKKFVIEAVAEYRDFRWE